MPVAHQDNHLTAGIRTTFGSLARAEFVPDTDDLVIERMRAAGVITLGKTNIPEFAAGGHTFNEVFGVTRNPYDRSVTAGDSSGGAAAALAAGMHALADGMTWADPSASRPGTATSSGCARRRAGSRCTRPPTATPGCPSRARWPGPWMTLRCCCR